MLTVWAALVALAACQAEPPRPAAPSETPTLAPVSSAPDQASPSAAPTPTETALPAPAERNLSTIVTPVPTLRPEVPAPSQIPEAVTPTVQAPTPAPTPLPASPGRPLTFSNQPQVPARDLYELARRFGRIDTDVTHSLLPRQHVGDSTTLWALDLDREVPFQVDAVLRRATVHADFYTEVGARFSDDVIAQAANVFENRIYPRVLSVFSPPGTSGQFGSIAMLHVALPAAAGYFDPTQEYSPRIYPFSNQRRLMYLNTRYTDPASPRYVGLVAHEFQHALHSTIDAGEEGWVDEGLSVLANLLFDDGEAFIYAYVTDHSDQLNAWTAGMGTAADYGSAGLLMYYLWLHYPDSNGGLGALVARPEDGFAGIDAYLREQGYQESWRELLAEWAAANYLDDRSSWDPYPDRRVGLGENRILQGGKTFEERAAPQFAPYYVGLDPGDDGPHSVRFTGASISRLIPEAGNEPAAAWWSGGDDGAHAVLTHAFDLREAEASALTLRIWHEIEESWDFAYVLVSTDGGGSWEPVTGPSMQLELASRIGQAFGPGYTGVSGSASKAAWIDETVDLSAYDGQEILVRIEYVTDGSVNLTGFALGGAFLPAAQYAWDPSSGPGDWAADGFFFGDGTVGQEFEVRLLVIRDDGTHEIASVELDGQQVGSIDVPQVGVERAALMVMPMAPATRQPARFKVSLDRLA